MDNSLQQQDTTSPPKTPPSESKKRISWPLMISAIILIALGMGAAYLSMDTNSPQTPVNTTGTVQVSPTVIIETSPTHTNKAPDEWTVMTSEACNLRVPIPPKKEPYYISPESSDRMDAVRYWRFEESKAPADRQTDNEYTDVVHIIMRADDALGSGYIAGSVYIQCGANKQNYTTEQLTLNYQKAIEAQSDAGMSIKKKESLNLWNKQVIALYPEGGMIDGSMPIYFLATPTHIYQISKVTMSANNSIKETTHTIFNQITIN